MARYYTPQRDHLGEEPDGRAFVIAHANVPIPVAQAERLGIIEAERGSDEQFSEVEETTRPRRSVRFAPITETAGAADGASGQTNAQHAPTTRKRAPSQKPPGEKGKAAATTPTAPTEGAPANTPTPEDEAASTGTQTDAGGEG